MKVSPRFTKQKHHVLKSTGEIEWFSPRKLQQSIERTGLQPKFCKKITNEVAAKVEAPISTGDIYKHTMKLLKKQSTVAATHYSLKKSLQELGPAGYTFEYFVSKYFEAIGFSTEVGAIMQGEFVKHEVDVIASKKNYQAYTECKFHNNSGRKNDIKIVLYVKARWDDLKKGPDGDYLREYYVASNTVFTQDAIAYSKGVGLKLLGVNAPEEESFLDKIKRYKLYPITSLIKLKSTYIQQLLDKKIILCRDLLDEATLLKKMGMTEKEIDALFNDIEKLLA